MPSKYLIYVKEHFTNLGGRPRTELKALRKLPGVRLVKPSLSIHSLIKGARAVVTISGTVGFEAGLLGKPCILLSPMFFRGLSSIRYAPNLEAVPDLLEAIPPEMDPELAWEQNDRDTLASFFQGTYPGIISDPHTLPRCVEEENILQLHHGFLDILRSLEGRNPA